MDFQTRGSGFVEKAAAPPHAGRVRDTLLNLLSEQVVRLLS